MMVDIFNTEFKCDDCGKEFKSKSTFAAHQNTHKEEPTTCTICNKEFKHQSGYKRHIETKHAMLVFFFASIDFNETNDCFKICLFSVRTMMILINLK